MNVSLFLYIRLPVVFFNESGYIPVLSDWFIIIITGKLSTIQFSSKIIIEIVN